ncbi:Rha family transcriptional regulator [Xenorhabdus bovienii]|uniref:Rha family transcriptional regulator n=1 Tax=Xenorhabdus bovienii TaxID=40576 RepID=A0AAJ1JEV7_XENBV|nr:Rha family transcriptional regulator [Xenorhabdus bovienii]MDE1480193.1 Rha family transcriptional regulator [Xenorhabdus bovienii]MDE9523665.1 Rha family transcriptional regulator [Xenorhabdus bovienii]MDE9526355.1 Rha family transcriptional regulator [Xenorhabdus bovienii]MDE9569783.1 Rha family transcriptional regulator [Xenorhabdus bovienii]
MKLVKTNKANLPVTEAPTMTSLEMVDYINAERKAKAEAEGLAFPCKKYRKLQHKDFLKKVPKVLGEEQSAKFSADYIDDKGRTQPCYRFPKREACLMAMSYSYELQAQVFDHMTELEGSKDINLMDLSGLTELTIRQMQDRVAQAEKFSFAEHGQKGSSLMTLRKKEKKAIKKAEQLVKDLIQFKLCDLGDFPDEGEPA